MTAEELKEKIEISRSSTVTGRAIIHACIKLNCEVMLSQGAVDRREIEQAEEFAREKILRLIYEDQRRELCDSMDELLSSCHPMSGDYEKFFTARERLMKAARHQQRSMDEKTQPPLTG